MSNDTQQTIVAAEKPGLSHLESRRDRFKLGLDGPSLAVVTVVIAVAGAIIYWQPWNNVTPAAVPGATGPAPATATPAPRATEDTTLAPFAASQHALAREQAQKALAAFVEKQLLLQESMRVDQWGQSEYNAAMAAAKAGDEEFVKEQFAASLASYEEAVRLLDALIRQGGETYDARMAAALAAVDARDAPAAQAALDDARIIRPDAADAQALGERIAKLPQVVYLLRTARNHELGGRVEEALATYEEVRALDPQTAGLAKLVAEAGQQQQQLDLNAHIAQGFAALDRKDFDAARGAFRRALAISPDNEVALGGMERLQSDYDLERIRRHRETADAALRQEDWGTAIAEYEAIRALDENIQFAVAGLSQAKAHERSEKLLTTITAQPQRLSSEKLFFEAQQILDQTGSLNHRGPKLNGLIARTEELLTLYRDPVDVVLRSDNATDIVMSNVGHLGFFDEKTLSLRPGTYTIRGSQRGCRDLYLSIEVLPGLEPLDLSCPERIAQGR